MSVHNITENKQKVFISYSHKDRDTCEKIAELFLHHEEVEVWYDKGLIPGEKYRKKITEEIKRADFFIVLISNMSVKSEWVEDELEWAKTTHKVIIPIWIEDVVVPDNIEMIIQKYHGLFWHLRTSDSQFVNILMNMVRGTVTEVSSEPEDFFTFGSDFTEEENQQILAVLEMEQKGRFSDCYEVSNALMLGRAYMFGVIVEKNWETARFYFKVADYFKNKDAKFYLLEMELETLPEEEADKFSCILKQIEDIAVSGSIPAKIYLANLYWYGKYGYPVDYKLSAELYEECARQGNPRAQYMMSHNYYYGDGVKQDYDYAKMYANLCMEQKYIKALRRWGIFYEEGIIVPKDYVKALQCYKEGVMKGDFQCNNLLGDLYFYGKGVEQNYEQAFEYYKEAEKAPVDGHKYSLRNAKYNLGKSYEYGYGIEQSYEKAMQKYLESHLYGHAEGKAAFCNCFLKTDNKNLADKIIKEASEKVGYDFIKDIFAMHYHNSRN